MGFFVERLSQMELLEKKKMREERRNKMRQQKFQRDFAYLAVDATYDDEHGNRRSTRMKGKKRSYKEHVGSDEEEDLNDVYQPSTEMDVDTKKEQGIPPDEVEEEPLFYPSGR